MRYSLGSRFEGCLLGAAVAEAVGLCFEEHLKVSSQTSFFAAGSPWLSHRPQNYSLGELVLVLAESLIHSRGVSLKSVMEADRSEKPQLLAQEMLLSSLPLSLFFHDNEAKRRQEFGSLLQGLPNADKALPAVLAWGWAMAAVLQEKLHRHSLIPEILVYLQDCGDAVANSPVAAQLAEVQMLLEQRAGLEMVKAWLARLADADRENAVVALAFYCFLSDAEDYRLSVLRAARIGVFAPITCALTGALSAAYNSVAGVPLGWRQGCPILWGGAGIVEIAKVSQDLLAAWSGVYQVAEAAILTEHHNAVAAPRVLRPR